MFVFTVRQITVPKRKEQVSVTKAPPAEQPPKEEKQTEPAAKQEQPTKPKKEKKEKEPKTKKPATEAAKPADISRICMKVGKIVKCNGPS